MNILHTADWHLGRNLYGQKRDTEFEAFLDWLHGKIIEKKVLLLRDAASNPELIVAAVPYLRDSDLRRVDDGESADDKAQKVKAGIREHYRIVCERAAELRNEHGGQLPIIGMGHLFAAGGTTTEGDGTRDLYVGNLGQVGLDAFPECFDYLALGHLHVPQRVDGSEHHRYSGSPLPMGFGEAAQQKEVLLIGTAPGGAPGITPLAIPCFQRLEPVKGDLEAIRSRLQTLADSGEDIWVEVQYTGETHVTNLREWVADTVQGSRLQVLRVQDRQQQQYVLEAAHVEETLDDLSPKDVFQRCLTANRVDEREQADLPPIPIRESATPESQSGESLNSQLIHRLSFTHLSELLQLPDDTQRRFYEIECMRGNWSVRELRRQINSLYYERSGLSKDKNKLSSMAHAKAETLQPTQIIRDPYVFEFLGLRARDVMGESDFEDALLDRLQDFLLEMGHGFCFEARQKRILIGDEHFFVDLVFYHRILKCHVLVELKTTAFSHEHLGQLNTYVAYYKKHQMTAGDQPPVGILLCTRKNEALVEFALGDMTNQLFVSRYAVEMPGKKEMEIFLKQIGREICDENELTDDLKEEETE